MTGDPVEVAPDVWWVGRRLPDDAFQCHTYLIKAGSDSVLVDPGSLLTIDETLSMVAQLADPATIKYLICHHPDPDIAASLGPLSAALPRSDIVVVTEWRARALLKHYGHRFDYWLIEDHDFRLPLSARGDLEFQLTPYLHFPGAFTTFDVASRTLFSSDLFGGFVEPSGGLHCHDIDELMREITPFHQHYMPTKSLLAGSLARIRQRWPEIRLIAPQHGRVIPETIVSAAFEQLSDLECGVFTLADQDHDLTRLIRLAEARVQLTESLLAIADPAALVTSINAVLRHTDHAAEASLYVDMPDEGWTAWAEGRRWQVSSPPEDAATVVELVGRPVAMLSISFDQRDSTDAEVVQMLARMAGSIRPSVDEFVRRTTDAHRINSLSQAAATDPLTGLRNRRALDGEIPFDDFALISLDIDHFKHVNDALGHGAGDRVLSRVSSLIMSSIRDTDRAYRWGGEEFLVVAPNAGGATGYEVAERIRQAVCAAQLDDPVPSGRVTISAGVATTVHISDDFSTVLERADRALYLSKARGRNQTTVDPRARNG